MTATTLLPDIDRIISDYAALTPIEQLAAMFAGIESRKVIINVPKGAAIIIAWQAAPAGLTGYDLIHHFMPLLRRPLRLWPWHIPQTWWHSHTRSAYARRGRKH